MLSTTEYARQGGVRCPLCESYDIRAGDGEFNEGRAFQRVGCRNCDATWAEDYQLTGFTDLEQAPNV